eukprot:7625734-Alexandrium_andersonii.AAC.1
MSASLVGSEMCIRDRPCAGGAHRSLSHRRCSGGSMASPHSGDSVDHTPVSYTHLTLPTICSV